ncbi:hypothetical protein [uncultured Anaeromusa sp.]|uniref:hypothetical protein n=1 Tax=uncultured Anaeromusa sp. TaxID=673273 RepID=UPI0029C858E2|nr:hypothetical protein [uncultured Anaeromusa sp.]
MIAVVDVAFFLIISFIVLLMASLVALLSKRFPQWQLSWKIVLFCAGCAILLAAVLPRLLLSWANLEMTVAILFVCAVGGAWAAAKLPDCMPVMSAAAVSPVAAEASVFSLTVSEKQQEEANTGEFWMDRQKEPLPKKEETQEQSLAIRKKKAPKAPKKEPAVAGALAADPAGEERLPIRRKKKAPVRAKNMDNAAPQTTIEPATAKMPETSPITETTIELATAKMPEAEPEKTATIAAAEDLPAASALASSMTEEPKEISAPEKPDFVEKTEEIPAAFVNVDACLEEAWRFREAGSWQTAQQVLQAGITQFADDEELPFLLIEEGALLKRYGRWEEAIAALEAALALPQVRRQPVWQKDIQQTLGYLQIFLGVLRQLKLEAVAPEAIPASVLDKVEAIYQQWRSRQ